VDVLLITLAAGGAAVGVALWARFLAHRRRYWFEELTERIPTHAAWWRKQREKTGELLYVAIGDSAAQGIGASRPHRSYSGVIARHIRERTGRTVRVVNLGISGATVRIAIDRQLPRLAKLQPDILTVSIGANDIAAFDPARFERDIRELLAALPGHAIVADLPTFYFLPAEKRVTAANRILREQSGERGLTVVPLHARMKRQGLWGVTTQFAGDLFHPNDRGYRVWASAFVPAVDRRLDELSEGRAETG
jgi:lysophospholipase L1-like esterase